MAPHILLAFLILTMAAHSSATFCVCKTGANPTMMQRAIDYACGAGADCNPIRQNGRCYNPNDIAQHCSYAVNSYFQRNAAKGATCVFDGVATPTNQDPSSGGCSYSATSGSTTPVTGVTPVSGTGVIPISGTGTNPTTTSPYTGTGMPGGGVGIGVAPTGSSFDDNDGGIKLQSMNVGSVLMTLAFLFVVITWN